MHAPSTHTEPGPQLLPQLPQLPWLLKMSVQLPPHTISPAAHWHVPAAQVWPPIHVVPHVPQFMPSLVLSMQAPLQSVRPVPQSLAHAPEEQTSPAAQALPHAPQLSGLDASATHLPSHSVMPAGHAHAAVAPALTHA
jgi:hypothetical protein